MSPKQKTIAETWVSLEAGECFFVPSLDAEKTLVEGLAAGYVPGKFPPLGKIGVYEGKAGVLFYWHTPNSTPKRTALPSLFLQP